MKYKPLDNIAYVKGGKRLPKGHSLTQRKTSHPYLRITDYSKDGLVNMKNLQYIEDETFNNISKYIIEEGNIFLSIVGTIGIVGYINSELNGASLTENAVKIIIKDDKIYDSKFLTYYLKSPKGQFEIDSRTVGSTQKKLAIKRIKNIEVPEININAQKKISNLLNSFDKKIEVNNKIISNLEEQAQAIFKSWFVDFEPFQDGNFVDSELGPIPEGWEVKKISEVSQVRSGKRPDKKLLEGDIPIYGASGITGWTNEYLINEPSILIGRVGTLGVVQKIYEEIWASDNTLIFNSQYLEFLYFFLKKVDYISLNRGSTQPLIAQKDINNLEIIFPSKNVLYEFLKIIKSKFKFMKTLENQNKTLAEIRDALLPKLMAGEIDVSKVNIKD